MTLPLCCDVEVSISHMGVKFELDMSREQIAGVKRITILKVI